MITAKKKNVLEKNVWVKAGRFDRGCCAPAKPRTARRGRRSERTFAGLFAPRAGKWKRALAIHPDCFSQPVS
jgi:hypothetical protein